MADPIAVANAFVTHYNSLFDSPDRTSLAPLYQDSSMLTYEGKQLQGQAAIINEYANPEGGGPIARFQTRTAVTTVDAQPIPQSAGLMVYATGNIIVEGEEHEQKYSHIFHLLPEGGSYWVQNEMFRLHVG